MFTMITRRNGLALNGVLLGTLLVMGCDFLDPTNVDNPATTA